MENLIEKFFNKSVECFSVDAGESHTTQTEVLGTWGCLAERAFAMLVSLTLGVAKAISDYRDEEGEVEIHVLGLSRADNDLILFVDYFDGEQSRDYAVVLSFRLDYDFDLVSFEHEVVGNHLSLPSWMRLPGYDRIETYDFLLNQNDFNKWFASSQD